MESTRWRWTGGAILVALSLWPARAGAQALTAVERQRIDSIFAPFDGTNRPGCALGVARNGTPVYAKGYGMADLQQGLAIDPGSIFHVASVSKQFAAFAVALLARDGKLSLDDPVRKYITELPDYGKPLTIRHLMYHTSGIRDHWELLGLAGWRYPDDVFTQEDVLRIVSRQQALNFDPGDEYLYSNSGYALIAMIVERVSGKTLREFSEERIFGPLGMAHTHVHDDHTMVVPHRTSAYEQNDKGEWRMSVPAFDTHGATSLFTTVGDLLRWQHNFVTATVGSRALLAEAETSAKLNNGSETGYGFGIAVGRYRGARTAGHGGADGGYRSDVVRFPDLGLDIAVLCNFAAAVPGQYSRSVAGVLLGDRLEPVAALAAPGPTVTLTQAQLDQVAGVYKAPAIDRVWRFEVREGRLFLTNFDAGLDALGPRRFTGFGAVVEFAGPEGGPATGARVISGGQVRDSMVRMPPVTPSRADLAAFAGEYWSDELGVGYGVSLGDSTLMLSRPKRDDAPMRPAFADAFQTPGVGTVRFVRQRGRVGGFVITGGRTRGVSFAKLEDGVRRR